MIYFHIVDRSLPKYMHLYIGETLLQDQARGLAFEHSYKPRNILRGRGIYSNPLWDYIWSLCCSQYFSSDKILF